MTATYPPSILLIHPPVASADTPPLTLDQAMAFLAGTSSQTFTLDARRGVDNATHWRDTLARVSTDHDTPLVVCPVELPPIQLKNLAVASGMGQSGPRLSLAGIIDQPLAADVTAQDDTGGIVQIQWRLTEQLPDLGFFRAWSQNGVWNHLVLDGIAATPKNCDAVARQPNIIHSWETVAAGQRACASTDVYHQVTPLPGQPLWRVVDDPVHRFVLLDRFGKKWLMRSRVEDGTGRIHALGDAMEYHFSPPDQLPEGYLDEICAMVAAGGTVAATHVRYNLERAHLIGYVLENNVIVGNSSLKNPRPEYIETVRRQSGLDVTGFVERGYTSVRPEYRGLGIGTQLLAGLTARAGDRKIFSVIAEDNEATKLIATRNRTRQVATYYSQQAGKQIGIWMPEWMIDASIKKMP